MKKIIAKAPKTDGAVYQLPPITLNGYKYIGYKIIHTKTIKSGGVGGNGKPITKTIIDDSFPTIYDPTTQQLQSNKAIANIARQMATQSATIASLMKQVSLLKAQKGSDK